MTYKLRKSDLSGSLSRSDTFLTDGHWAVKEALLDFDPRLVVDPSPLDEDKVNRVFPDSTPITITRTNEIRTIDFSKPDTDIVIFAGPESNGAPRLRVGFTRRYVTIFGLWELRGVDPDHAWTTEARDIVLMPHRIPEVHGDPED